MILSSLLKSNGMKKYGTNTIWLLFEKVAKMFVALFIGIWVARYLGPHDFGILNYVTSFVFLFSAIATLGLDGIVTRELINKPSNTNHLLGTSFLLKIISSTLVLILIYIVSFFLDLELKYYIFIMSMTLVFQAFNIIDLYFQSKVISKYSVISRLSALLISSVFKVLLITNGFPLIYFIFSFLLDAIFIAIFYIYMFKKVKMSINHWRFDFKLAIKLIGDSWPLMLSGIVVSAYMKLDQIMIQHMLSEVSVGYYSAAVRLSEVWYFIPVAISSSLFPAIINAREISEKLYLSRLQLLYDALTLVSISLAIVVTFLGDDIIYVLYGKDYIASSEVLIVHIWSGIFVFLGVARGGWVLGENLQKYTFFYLSCGLIVNVVLNILFIPTFGIKGAAYTTLASQIVSVILAPSIFKETRIAAKMAIKSILIIPFIIRLIKHGFGDVRVN